MIAPSLYNQVKRAVVRRAIEQVTQLRARPDATQVIQRQNEELSVALIGTSKTKEEENAKVDVGTKLQEVNSRLWPGTRLQMN